MFKLAKDRIVWWPAVVKLPQDGGTVEEHEFQVQLKLLPVADLRRSIFNRDKDEDDKLLAQHVLGWRDLKGEDGEALLFNAENLAALIEIGYVRAAINTALIEASSGSAAVKNSSRGSAG